MAFGIAIAVPGAIRRGHALQVLALAAFGGAVAPFTEWALSPAEETAETDAYLRFHCLWPVATVLAVGVAEWLVAVRPLRWGTLGWMTYASATTATLASTLALFVWYSVIADSVRDVIALTAITGVAWTALPVGTFAGNPRGRAIRGHVVVFGVTAVAFCAGMFTLGVRGLAKASLLGYGPLSARSSVYFIANHANDSDWRFLLDRLAETDWDAPHEYPVRNGISLQDWRENAVWLMILHDEEWAAERLAAVLLDTPSRALIDMTDGAFVRQRRYEVAPILARYALLDSMTPSFLASYGTDRFKLALSEMQIPHVVPAWLIEVECNHMKGTLKMGPRGELKRRAPTGPVVVPERTRARMAKLLGVDVGPSIEAWHHHYASREWPTPLPPSLSTEMDEIQALMLQYETARNAWVISHPHSATLDDLGEGAPKSPNWNVPATRALAAEVDDFCDAVRDRIGEFEGRSEGDRNWGR